MGTRGEVDMVWTIVETWVAIDCAIKGWTTSD